MNDNVPKLPIQQPQIVIEHSIVNTSPTPNKEKNPFDEPAQQADNFGGQFMAASGTANASIVSPSAPPDEEYVYYIPEFAPLPQEELQKQHLGKDMERVTNPVKNK